jgi:hypothetical protein
MYFGSPSSRRKLVHAETIVAAAEIAELVARTRLAALQTTHDVAGFRVVDAARNTVANCGGICCRARQGGLLG